MLHIKEDKNIKYTQMEEDKNIVIKHVEDKNKGFFAAIKEGRDAGLMTYVYKDDHCFIIDHTEVDDAFNGQGVGKAMVTESIQFARYKGLKIIPLCPFVKAMFKRYPSFDDVLYRP